MALRIVALTGASGAIYGVRLIEEFLKRGDEVEVVASSSGLLLLKEELGIEPGNDLGKALLGYIKALGQRHKVGRKSVVGSGPKAAERHFSGSIRCHKADDIGAFFSSGSSRARQMAICPCSMGTLSRVSTGASTNLIERAADCVLKERGTLVVVPRETPLNSIHLENMLRLSKAGAVILPAMPAFYTRPESVDDMVDFVVGKVLDAFGVDNDLYRRWNGLA